MRETTFQAQRKMVINHVRKAMGWSPAKAGHWFALPNPLLGNVSPHLMVELGRFDRLMRIIDEQLAEGDEIRRHPSDAKPEEP